MTDPVFTEDILAALNRNVRLSRQMSADLTRLRHAKLTPTVLAALPALAEAGLSAAPAIRTLADEFAPIVEPPRPTVRRRLRYTLRIASEAARERLALWIAPWLGDDDHGWPC